MTRSLTAAWIMVALTVAGGAGAAQGAAPLRVPLRIDRPARLSTPQWPITVGVPFAAGVCHSGAELTVVDDASRPVPCQIVKTGDWPDGSLRWVLVDFVADPARQYALVRGKRDESEPRIKTSPLPDALRIDTGAAQFIFAGEGGVESLELKGPGGTGAVLPVGAFYAVDSQGRRAHFRAGNTRQELSGPQHTVVRQKGEYLTQDGQRVAAAVIYYHFYAGLPVVRISHKFIVTEDTNKLWFRDIGMELALQNQGDVTASFNVDHADINTKRAVPLKAGGSALMVQEDFPHFGSESSRFTLRQDNGETEQILQEGAACGDWVDVSSPSGGGGIAVQLPAFAETFPKAFVAAPDKLTIKFWAPEAGKELDFRTPSLMRDYFGHDWIPADHKIANITNNANGTARTHEVWIYLHDGQLSDQTVASFGATREPTFALPDAQWIADSGVMGPLHPKDTRNFPDVERVIEDYFNRGVLAGHKVFPAAGYLYWGMYPYSQQPWELKDGKWYPKVHRLSRVLEYNLKRHVWLLAARSGERKYHDYARKYTRLLHDIAFANWNTKPQGQGLTRGRLYQGAFDSPIVWADRGAYLAYASSEDIIQFVYDYFLTGDYHSRDMAQWWKEAMIDDLKWDVDEAVNPRKFYPTVVFLRMLGSSYELDHDPKVLEYGHKVLQRTVSAENEVGLNPEAKQNFSKAGDTFSVFFYYYVSTGDELALLPLLKLAEFDYRWGRLDFMNRSSAVPYAYAYAYWKTGEPAYARYLAQLLDGTARNYKTLADAGIDFDGLNPRTSTPWGQLTLTGSGPIFSGLPVAMKAVAEHGRAASFRPLAEKSLPVHRTHLLLKKEKPGPARVDVYINNFGDRSVRPRLLTLDGKELPLEVLAKDEHREIEPSGEKGDYWQYSPWYFQIESHLSYRLGIPEAVATGTYELDLGENVKFKVLDSDIELWQTVAPDGMGVMRGRRYYFRVPAGLEKVDFFAHRATRFFDPQGEEINLGQVTQGRGSFATGGKSGVWSLETGTDSLLSYDSTVDTFIKFFNAPLALGLGEPARAFDADLSRFQPRAAELPQPEADKPFAPGRFGQALGVLGQHAEVPLTAGSQVPHARGTVEFWFRPLWSTSDLSLSAADRSTHRQMLYKLAPVEIDYFIDPDNAGRTGRYNVCRLNLSLPGASRFPVHFMFEAGQWYHIAATWDINGKNSDVRVFINGRRRAWEAMQAGLGGEGFPNDLPAEKLQPAGDTLRIGSAPYYNRGSRGEVFDELRVSTSLRYRDDFEPPTAPFTPDADTCILMHFDGDLAAEGACATGAGKLVRGWKMP